MSKTGQKVKKGDLLITFDLDAIQAAGYLCTTPLIVCNTDDYAAVRPLASRRRRPRPGPAAGGVTAAPGALASPAFLPPARQGQSSLAHPPLYTAARFVLS